MLTRSNTKKPSKSFATIDDGKSEMKEFYRKSRLEEIKMLSEKGSFAAVPVKEVEGNRLYRPRFADLIKNDG